MPNPLTVSSRRQTLRSPAGHSAASAVRFMILVTAIPESLSCQSPANRAAETSGGGMQQLARLTFRLLSENPQAAQYATV